MESKEAELNLEILKPYICLILGVMMTSNSTSSPQPALFSLNVEQQSTFDTWQHNLSLPLSKYKLESLKNKKLKR